MFGDGATRCVCEGGSEEGEPVVWSRARWLGVEPVECGVEQGLVAWGGGLRWSEVWRKRGACGVGCGWGGTCGLWSD